MNVIMTSQNQKDNSPSFIRLSEKLTQANEETLSRVQATNEAYNDRLSRLLYLLNYFKTLEEVENDVFRIQKGYLSSTWANPSDRYVFNRVIVETDAEYITVTPIGG